MAEFKMLKAVRRVHSKLVTLDFRRANFGLSSNLLDRIAWNKALEGRGAQANWLIFGDHLHQVQEWCIPTKRKTGKMARRFMEGKKVSWTNTKSKPAEGGSTER